MWSITKLLILYFLCLVVLGIGAVAQTQPRPIAPVPQRRPPPKPPVRPNQPPGPIKKTYNYTVSSTSYSRLCANKTILTVNGMFPGPTIYATTGEKIMVNVHNSVDHKITIHWHGVKMPRYPWSDGPEYVTQCPIRPNTTFSQLIVLSDEVGTLWWHAHSEWWRATIYGAIIIYPPKRQPYPFPKPDDEVPILLGDWWKSPIEEVMEEFLYNGGDPNVSDAFLINGQPGDLYPCSKQDTFRVNVTYGKTYLFRMVNAVMNNIMFFRIANHKMTIVGTDAAYTKQFETDYIAISPGQTIDFLLRANQPPNHYYIASRVYASNGAFDNTTTTAILQYTGKYTPSPSPSLPTFPEFNSTSASVNFTTRLRSLRNVEVPRKITVPMFITLSINTAPCEANRTCEGPFQQRFQASVNNLTLVFPTTAILQAYHNRTQHVYTTNFPDKPPLVFNYTESPVPRDLWTPEFGTRVKVLEYGATVEIVFQGTNTVSGVDHPMHLHGYSFYVVGSGLGNFNKTEDPKHYNLVDPPLMETIAVPKNGWTTIRFKADNPGVWFMHCHFERHVSWGMGMTFIVKDGKERNATMYPPPPDMPRC